MEKQAVEKNTEYKSIDYFSGLKRMYPSTNDTATEFFALIISMVFTSLAVLLMNFIPVDDSKEKYAGVLLLKAFQNCHPEPLELPLFVLTVILIPVSFLTAYSILKKKLEPVPIIMTNVMQFILLFVICCVSASAYIVSSFDLLHISEVLSVSVFVLVPLTAVILFSVILAQKIRSKTPQKVICFTVLAVIFAYSIFRIVTINYSFQYSAYNYHHYYAVWYPIVKVSDGQTIGTDFKSIYGFYPYIVVPILKLLGGVNQTSSSILIAVLLTIVAVSYCAFSYKFIKNKILALFVGAACALYGPFSILGDRLNGGVKMYLQYNPLRSVCIASVLIAVMIRSSIKSKRGGLISDIIISILLGLGIVWNIETGLIAVIIWSAYRVFDTALENKLLSKKTLTASLKALLYAAISIAEFFALVSLITFVRSGQLLPLKDMFFGITAFAGTGFFMIRITFGLWMVLAVIFAVSVLKGVPYLTKYKNITPETKGNITGLFTAAVSGIGTLTHYIGRSHVSFSLFAFPCAVICCGLLYENFLAASKSPDRDKAKTTTVLGWVKRIMCIVFIAAVFISGVYNLVYSFTEDFNKVHYPSGKELSAITLRDKEIKKWADKNNNGKIPNNLLNYSIFTNQALGKKSYEKVCEQVDWFYVDNARTYIDFINSHRGEAFMIELEAINILIKNLPKEYMKAFDNFNEAYEIKDEFAGNVYIYVPKTH